MASFVTITQIDFVDRIFATAEKTGVATRLNKNGDRQLDFNNKSLTEEHLRRLFQDITAKMGVYTRSDMDSLLSGSRPCAIAPFFDLATKAGLAVGSEEAGRTVYRFRLSDRVA